MNRRRSVSAGLVIALTSCTLGTELRAQLQLAPVVGIVLDAKGVPITGALVVMSDPLGAEMQRAVTDPTGRTMFPAVAPGRYVLHTSAPGAAPFDIPLVVTGALPVEITLRVPASVSDTVIVEGARDEDPSSRRSLARESLERLPVRARTRALQDAIATLAGWSTEDNGLLHTRGVDDGFLYVVDGVPVYERLDALFGFAPDISGLSGLTVLTGYVPPEFGHKAGGVIEVRSSSSAREWSGVGDVRVGQDATRDGSLTAGGQLGDRARVRAGMTAIASDRFLDPVHPDNLHNSGAQARTHGQIEWTSRAADQITAGWSYGRSRFDVPNNDDQEEAGQDQRQTVRQGSFNATWQRAWRSALVTQAAAYHRRTHSRLDPSARDLPLTAAAARDLVRTGVLFALTRQAAQHLFKVGIEVQRLTMDEAFTFAITDEDEAREAGFRDEALAFTREQPFGFAGRAHPTVWSVYAQDSWQATSRLTFNGGFRFDRSTLLLHRTAISPRAGLAFRVSDASVVRASVSRFFQHPQPEYLLLSSSPEARVLSAITVGGAEGGADVEPERQWAVEVGAERQMGPRVRLDVAYWYRRMTDVSDPNVFAGTTIIFPNAVAGGHAHGMEARVELLRQRGWSAYANASAGKVVQTGPVTGGLFLEDEVEELGPGVEFTPDHDQRLTAGGGVTWQHAPSRVMISATARYETGTPVPEDDVDERLEQPGAETADFESGRVRPRTVVSIFATVPVVTTPRSSVTAGFQITNLFDARYAYNFGNPFSGTHFGAPRRAAVTVRVSFR